VAEGEIRTEVDGPIQLGHGLVGAASKPERPAHGPVHRGIAFIGHDPLRRGFVSLFDFRFALLPVLEGVLEVREGQARVGA